jgi:hypothetical protein
VLDRLIVRYRAVIEPVTVSSITVKFQTVTAPSVVITSKKSHCHCLLLLLLLLLSDAGV